MEEKYKYEWIDNNFVVTFYGDITFKDIMDANDIIIGDKRFKKMAYQIFDYSQITSIDLEKDIVNIISNYDIAAAHWNKKMKVATVTADPTLQNLIEKYNEKMGSSSWIARTFLNIEDATSWCNEE